MESSSFDLLPDEMLLKVCNEMSQEDLGKFIQTSRRSKVCREIWIKKTANMLVDEALTNKSMYQNWFKRGQSKQMIESGPAEKIVLTIQHNWGLIISMKNVKLEHPVLSSITEKWKYGDINLNFPITRKNLYDIFVGLLENDYVKIGGNYKL